MKKIKNFEKELSLEIEELGGNGLSGNGLSGNGLSGNGLSGNGFSGNGIDSILENIEFNFDFYDEVIE